MDKIFAFWVKDCTNTISNVCNQVALQAFFSYTHQIMQPLRLLKHVSEIEM